MKLRWRNGKHTQHTMISDTRSRSTQWRIFRFAHSQHSLTYTYKSYRSRAAADLSSCTTATVGWQELCGSNSRTTETHPLLLLSFVGREHRWWWTDEHTSWSEPEQIICLTLINEDNFGAYPMNGRTAYLSICVQTNKEERFDSN